MNEPRFPALDPASMTTRQQEVAGKIAGGPRGGVRGPFLALIHHPDLAEVVQQVGEQLRYKSTLPLALIELGILVVARHWTCQFEWVAHERVARTTTDLPNHIVRAIQVGAIPEPLNDDQRIVYDFATATVKYGAPKHAVYDEAAARFGRDGVLELIVICGYYSMLAMLLNTAQIPLPEGTLPPLREKLA